MDITQILQLSSIIALLLTIVAAIVTVVLFLIRLSELRKLHTESQTNEDQDKYKVEVIVEYPSGKRIETREVPPDKAEQILRMLDVQQTDGTATSGKNTINKKSQAQAILSYDTADSFLLDIGAELEQAISPLLPVKPQHILGGASPLLPVLELVIKYGPEAAGAAAGVFFSSTLKKLGENFANQLANKFTRTKNDKSVRLIITLTSDQTTISASVEFDDYKTIADAMKATQQMINEAYETRDTNLDHIPQDTPISFRDEEGRMVSRSNLQFRYKYDAATKKWILESIHKLSEQNDRA